MELRYKKPVPIDCDLITVARVTRDTRKLFEGEGEIILPNGEIAVTAKAKYVKMPIDQIADECDMAEEWLPIPDILKSQGDNKYNFLCVIKKPSIYR